jgi:hypothetical protein
MAWSFNLVVYFLFPTYNSFRLILQEPSNQSPQPGPSSLPEPSITQAENKNRCRRCIQRFPDRRQLYLHGMQEHYQSGGGADFAYCEMDTDTEYMALSGPTFASSSNMKLKTHTNEH